jgi:hypothetical protein
VDHDAELLAQARLRTRNPGACQIDTREMDLAVLTVAERDIFDGRALVTASALLDLVSDDWLRSLATRCRESGCAVLFALSYDGRIECSPQEPGDDAVRELVNLHQRTDKGFGPALGGGAPGAAVRCFAGLGYRMRREPSDWTLTADQTALQQQLIDGWAEAALAIAPAQHAMIGEWRTRRLAHVEARRSRLIVGHEDLAGWL